MRTNPAVPTATPGCRQASDSRSPGSSLWRTRGRRPVSTLATKTTFPPACPQATKQRWVQRYFGAAHRSAWWVWIAVWKDCESPVFRPDRHGPAMDKRKARCGVERLGSRQYVLGRVVEFVPIGGKRQREGQITLSLRFKPSIGLSLRHSSTFPRRSLPIQAFQLVMLDSLDVVPRATRRAAVLRTHPPPWAA